MAPFHAVFWRNVLGKDSNNEMGGSPFSEEMLTEDAKGGGLILGLIAGGVLILYVVTVGIGLLVRAFA